MQNTDHWQRLPLQQCCMNNFTACRSILKIFDGKFDQTSYMEQELSLVQTLPSANMSTTESPALRTVLLALLITAMGGAFFIEQPGSSYMEFYDKMRWLFDKVPVIRPHFRECQLAMRCSHTHTHANNSSRPSGIYNPDDKCHSRESSSLPSLGIQMLLVDGSLWP